MAQRGTPGNGKPTDPIAVIRSYLALAIQIGAPAYNLGDHRGCYEVYACTARMLVQAINGVAAEPAKHTLRAALQHCATLTDPNAQAWAMRHAFDTILGDSPGRDAGTSDAPNEPYTDE